jgi:hypothetical protein
VDQDELGDTRVICLSGHEYVVRTARKAFFDHARRGLPNAWNPVGF